MKYPSVLASSGRALMGSGWSGSWRGWCASLVILASAGGAAAQPCVPGSYGARGYFRLVTSIANGSGLNEAQIGGTTYGVNPVDLVLTNSNSNQTGCAVTLTGHAWAHYGDIGFSVTGSGNNCATNGVIMSVDSSGGGPRGDSLDQLVITSATLPQGTPVSLHITWTLMGTGVVNDPVPQMTVLADLNAGSPLGNYNGQLTAAGSLTCTIPTAVGLGVSVRSALDVSMNAGSLSGAMLSSATMSANYRLVTNCTSLTPGAGFVSCGGGNYSACSDDFNGDGDVGTDADIEAFFACIAGNCCATCGSADFNGDGDVGTDADIESFFRVLGGGSC